MRSTTCSNRSASLISAARQPSAVAVRTAGLSEDTRKRSCPGSHSTRPGVHLDQSRLQNDTGTHQRHRLSGKRRRIRTAPSGRPIDHHDSFPAQEHGSGPAVGNVHAGPSLLHRQSTTYQELRKRPGFRKRQRIHPHRRELPGNVPTVHRNPLPESITENRVRNLEEKSYPSRNGHSTARQQTTKRDHMLSGYLWEANIWRCVIKAHCCVIIGSGRVIYGSKFLSPLPSMPCIASILTTLRAVPGTFISTQPFRCFFRNL